MLSREMEHKIRQHLRLARGLLDTAVIKAESSEFEERNALSRAYYAAFHAFCALMLSCDVEPEKSHGGLQRQVRQWLGKSFGQFVRDAYEARRFADYDPGWRPIRHSSDAKLRIARTNVLWAALEAEKKLK